MTDLIPRSLFITPRIFEDEEEFLVPANGLSMSEDDKNVYVEAALPGVAPKDIDITFEKGTLWIRGTGSQFL